MSSHERAKDPGANWCAMVGVIAGGRLDADRDPGGGVIPIGFPRRKDDRSFNRVGSRDPDVGDGFLMRRGFTVAAVGWEFDLSPEGDLVRISVPAASDNGSAITGIVRGSFTPDRRDPTFRVGPCEDRHLLAEDVDPVVQRAAAHWDLLMGPVATSSSSR